MTASRFYAMDTCFDTPIGSYALGSQWAILAELGFDGGYLSLWDEASWADLDRVSTVARTHGLAVAGVYLMFDIVGGDHRDLVSLPRAYERRSAPRSGLGRAWRREL